MEEELAFNAAMIDETHVRSRWVALRGRASRGLTRVSPSSHAIGGVQEDIERISRNVVEVNSVFQHLAQLVDEQRSDIGSCSEAAGRAPTHRTAFPHAADTIEGNVMDTEERVRSGLKHVDKAADKQRQARGKMCALLVCLLVTGGVLLLLYKLTSSSGATTSSPEDGQDVEDGDSGSTDAVLHSAATAVQAAKSAFRRTPRHAL